MFLECNIFLRVGSSQLFWCVKCMVKLSVLPLDQAIVTRVVALQFTSFSSHRLFFILNKIIEREEWFEESKNDGRPKYMTIKQ